jgi:hypothetical protein
VDRELRDQLDHDFAWHHEFWTKHNRDFAEEKKAFTDAYRKEHSLPPDVRVPPVRIAPHYTTLWKTATCTLRAILVVPWFALCCPACS